MHSHVLQNRSRFEKDQSLLLLHHVIRNACGFPPAPPAHNGSSPWRSIEADKITGWRKIEVVQCSRPSSVNRSLSVLSGLPCPWKKLCRNTFGTRLLPESFKAWSLCTPPGLILRNLCLCLRCVQMSRPFLGIIISFFTVESECVFCEVIPWRTNFS